MNQGQTVFSNFFWRFAERCGAQGISFIVSMVLARLLEPEMYGMIALVTVFTSILQVFVDSGMANALIQKKDADDLDFSTVFYFNFAVCVGLYVLMCAAAPWIAEFYKMPGLTPVIRALSFTLVISGVKNVQQAYVSRNMLFKRFFYATLGGTIGAAVVGITMAYMGFGVWALVAQQLFNTTVDTIILWITVKWRPKRMFSFGRLKGLFSFGSKMLASSLLDTLYSNLRALLIGRIYTSEDLAYYNRGDQIPRLIITNINTSINSVLFPAMASEQDSTDHIKRMTRRAIRISSYIIWPMMVGLGVCAPTFVRLVLTEKWLPCVPYIQIFCFTYGFWPVHTANLTAIKALGRSDIFMRLEIIKKLIGIVALIISVPMGVFAIAFIGAATTPISVCVNSSPNRKLLGYSYREQLSDIIPSMLLAGAMGIPVYLLIYLPIHQLGILLLQIALGIALYIALSKMFYTGSFDYLYQILMQYINKLRKQ